MLISGRIFQLVMLIVVVSIATFLIREAQKGRSWNVRRVPALDYLDEVIGRAAEMGRPVHFIATDSPGYSMNSAYAPVIVAAISCYSLVASRCAELGLKLITSCGSADTIPLHQETARMAYEVAGKIDELEENVDIRYVSGSFATQAALMGMMAREQPAAHIALGAFGGAGYLGPAEVGRQFGVLSLCGTTRHVHIPYMTCTCDYVVIGEELMAASAYLTRKPLDTANIASIDYFKMICLALTGVGIVLSTLGSDAIIQLLSY
jgi:hypothetical protein